MSDLIRDAPIGQLIRWATNKRFLKYPEEREDFELPSTYLSRHAEKKILPSSSSVSSTDTETPAREEAVVMEQEEDDDDTSTDLEKIQTSRSVQTTHTAFTALSQSISRADLEHQFSQAVAATLEKGPSRPIEPSTLSDGTVLVDWYSTDDQENPQNWSSGKKAVVLVQILIYTMGVYMGSAIYTPSIPGVMKEFNVSLGAASLGLSMYVLAYGIGPLVFSPLSEIPRIGRNWPYMVSFSIFVILTIPAALVKNFSGLIALRFFQGLFGSPALATGGATLGDMYSLLKLPYVLSLWAFAATCGPALGPMISGFSVEAKDWTWSLWELLWLNAPILISLFLFLPETSPSNILLRRAKRLRTLTSSQIYKSASEIEQAHLTPRAIATEALFRPFQLMLLDPSIAFTAIYTALVYAIFYSFFEAFPLVYEGMYHFTAGETGLTFLSVTVGTTISIAAYWFYISRYVTPSILRHGPGIPEHRLRPALIVTWFVPAGLFIFGWTTQPQIHWIVSCIGIVLTTIGIFLIIQCIFMYLPLSYPQYVASLFAGNDFLRSVLAAGSIHFSTPMFGSLGVARGVSLLAGLTVGCSVGVYVLYFLGAGLRARSRFAAK